MTMGEGMYMLGRVIVSGEGKGREPKGRGGGAIASTASARPSRRSRRRLVL
jgi:hypothetical protein